MRTRLMRVVGHSMEPALRPGDLVWVEAFRAAADRPQSGEVVVARPSRLAGKAVIKRLTEVSLERDEFILCGDNPSDSHDSRALGPVKRNELIGRIRLRVWPLGRVASAGHGRAQGETRS